MGTKQSLNLGAFAEAFTPMEGVTTVARASPTPGLLGGRLVGLEAQLREKARLEQELENDKRFFANPPEDYIRCPSCGVVYAVNTSRSATSPDLAPGLTSMLPACYSKDLPRQANLSVDEALRHMHRSRFRCASCSVDFCRCGIAPYHWGWSCDGWSRRTQLAEQVCPVGSCRWCAQPCMQRMRRNESLASSCCGSDEGNDLKRFPPALSCAERERRACGRRLACGHWCAGVRGESTCPPCLQPDCRRDSMTSTASLCAQEGGSQSSSLPPLRLPDADEWCPICWTDALGAAPVVLLACGHVLHHHCAEALVRRGHTGGRRLTFKSIKCPLCKAIIQQSMLDVHVAPQFCLYEKVRRKALQRWVVERREPAAKLGDLKDEEDIATLAMQKMTFYECSRCGEPYYGGEVECAGQEADREEEAAEGMDEDVQAALAMELVCRGCASKGQRQCPEHGTDFLAWKCRYCCEREAQYLCFGTTHFCRVCHDAWQSGVDQRRRLQMGRMCLGKDRCILGGRHPLGCKNGRDEYALGCSVCAQDAEYGLPATKDARRSSAVMSGRSCALM